jgi:hypothetical protein
VIFGSLAKVFGVLLVVRDRGTSERQELFGLEINQWARRLRHCQGSLARG